MPVQLMKLRGVPEDELEELAELLDTHDIEYYETTAGNWGISLPALWVKDQAMYDKARPLLDAYQAERAQRMRAHYEERRAAGETRTFLDMLRESPLKVIASLLLVAGLLYLSTVPFFRAGGV